MDEVVNCQTGMPGYDIGIKIIICLQRILSLDRRVTTEKKERARELRREMTPAETILWREIRGDRLGVHFRRQQVIAGFIVDFYCHKAGLVVELDGGVHQGRKQKEDDDKRDKALREMGLRILRFKNEEVCKEFICCFGKDLWVSFRGWVAIGFMPGR